MAGTSVVQPGLTGMSAFWAEMGTFGGNVDNGTVTLDNYKEQVDLLYAALNGKGL
jgi:hypothetical protein